MRTLYILGIAAMLAVSGCERRAPDVAASGGAPELGDTPIGPIPGSMVQQTATLNPFAEDRVGVTEGRKLFLNYNCYGCHGGRGGGGMGPSLRDQVWRYGDSDAHVFDSISRGRGQGMPAWGTKVPQQQIWKLVAYVK